MTFSNNTRLKDGLKSLIIHAVLLIALIIMIIPFWWMIATSLKTKPEILQFPPTWFPHIITFENYVELFSTIDFAVPLKNSIFIAVMTTFLSLTVSAMSAYAIAKFDFKWKDHIFMLMLATIMVPGQVTTIPVFLLLKSMGLLDTYAGLIVIGLANVGTIFFLRQFLTTISDSYIEAAKIDGAGDFRIFFEIILPMMKPSLITMGIFIFTGAWNAFFWPLIIAADDRYCTLTLAMTILDGQHAGNIGLNMAGAIVIILPLLILFIFAQKYIMLSLNIGGVKE